MCLAQNSAHPFNDLLNLNSPPAASSSLLVDVFSEAPPDLASAPPPDVSDESFSRFVVAKKMEHGTSPNSL